MTEADTQKQMKLAKFVAERATHILATESFKERKKEVAAEMKEVFGKDHGINIEMLAMAYLRDQEKKQKAIEFLRDFDEASHSVSLLEKYIAKGSVADNADKYLTQ